jgi:hypothetical protein
MPRDQHDIAQVFVPNDVQDILNMGFEIDRRISQMLALTLASIGRRDQAMPCRAHQRMHLLPRPPP